MTGVPARLLAWLAFAAAAHAAAASDRFVPGDASFVVANVTSSMPDDNLRPLVDAWRANRESTPLAVALAGAFLDKSRSSREPMYVGRAEAVLAPLVRQAGVAAAPRRLYASTLQFRHDFTAAEKLLDGLLDENPRDVAARIQRASVRLVRGDFAGARADCAQLIAAGGAEGQVGITCLAEALAGAGQIDRAQALLAALAPGRSAADAYLLAVRAELAERAGSLDGAIADYRAALALAPNDDSIRAALADALAARGGGMEAFALLDVERPSLALRVRRALLSPEDQRAELMATAAEWLALEVSRGDAIHAREGALLALGSSDNARALEAARANFEAQRELPDVRVLARAAVAARDREAQAELRRWLDSTGFRDVVTEKILGRTAGG